MTEDQGENQMEEHRKLRAAERAAMVRQGATRRELDTFDRRTAKVMENLSRTAA